MALKQIQDQPRRRPREPRRGSCSRPRSPAGWSTRGSCRSTGWATTPTAGRSTPCGSSGATASRRRSSGSTEPTAAGPRSRRAALALRQLLRRFIDVCNAMAYAHSRGVLHRDLKPGNMMLGPYGETLVVDWGLAKPIGRPEGVAATAERTLRPSSGSGLTPTQMGSAIGTPAFMSPEQAAGRLDELGPASDVYSLGAMLYSLLTGRAPFDEATTSATCCGRSGRASSRRRGRSNRAVPPALEAVCLKAMAQGAGRPLPVAPGTGRRDRALAGRRAGRRPGASRSRSAARRWARRHRTAVTAAAAALLAGLIGLAAAAAVQSERSPPWRRRTTNSPRPTPRPQGEE